MTSDARTSAAPPALIPAMAPIESPDGDFDFSGGLLASAVPVAAADSDGDGVLEASVLVELSVASGEAAAEEVVGGAVSKVVDGATGGGVLVVSTAGASDVTGTVGLGAAEVVDGCSDVTGAASLVVAGGGAASLVVAAGS